MSSSLQAIEAAGNHEEACEEMTKGKQTLCLNPFVGNYAHQCRHTKTNEALNGIEPADIGAKAFTAKIKSHADEVGSPNSELKKVE